MKRAMVDRFKCKGCIPCNIEENCSNKAIIREDDIPWVDFYLCSGCMKCKTYCPFNAVEEIARPCGNNKIGW